jgi:polyisoprenyl-phosphate glycosyltransferase
LIFALFELSAPYQSRLNPRLIMNFEIVIPVFNESLCIDETFKRLITLRNNMTNTRVTLSFINDGSKDDTLSRLVSLKGSHPRVKIVNLSRNFGHQLALTAGLDHVDGDVDYVGIIDGDLQDPPELLIPMLEIAKSGFEVVYGQRKSRAGESFFKLVSAKAFYKILSLMCDVPIPRDTGDFRVISKKVLVQITSMREKHRFVRGLVPFCGHKQVAFSYDRAERFAGETKYPLKKMVRFALDAIFSFSSKPLKFIRYIGLIAMLASLLLGLKIIYIKLIVGDAVPGYSSLVVIIVFFSSVQMLSLSLIGEYVGRIFEESKQRPLYFIDKIF